ncbi:MAG: hypothetical protein V3W32_05860 [Gemmatimonadota bacterium]
MGDLREDFAALLADHVHGCGDRVMVRDLPYLHAAWDGTVPLASPWRNWFLHTFLGHQEAARALRGIGEIKTFFFQMYAQLHELTGEPRGFPVELIEELQRRVLVAMYPSCYEIAAGATTHPADYVSRGLKALGASEAAWRKRF